MKDISMGIYEKALPLNIKWQDRLELAGKIGFDFVEISIDESDERLSRLDWTASQRKQIVSSIRETGIKITTMCLSGHRKFPLGSADINTRMKALDIFKKAIDFALDLGIRIIQLAGYYVYYEPHTKDSIIRYQEGLYQGLEWASQACVMLGLENVDGNDVDSVKQGMYFVDQFKSPWFQMYPDIGNLAEHNLDVCAELELGKNHIVAVHAKDTRPGEPRRVSFGEGTVPFKAAFKKLREMEFQGPIVLEMWNDDSPDSVQRVEKSREWIYQHLLDSKLIQT
ncbi:MAG: L-ribulose-5-phosphate 3-epimerase [Spirochaetes bacterium]|nr:L-ribulose-5-phosphate 3-epimerase [Spirochaetota bacterium]